MENIKPKVGTLMIVEDDKILLKVFERYFVKHYNLITANSGDKALNMIKEGAKPDVILSDQRMPGLSGDEFLAETIKYLPDVVRVIITAHSDPAEIISAINKAHSYMFLRKPIQEIEIVQAVRICFNHYYSSLKNKMLQNKLKLQEKDKSDRQLFGEDVVSINIKEFNKRLSLLNEYFLVNPIVIFENLLWKLSFNLKASNEEHKFLLQTLNLMSFKSNFFLIHEGFFYLNQNNDEMINKYNRYNKELDMTFLSDPIFITSLNFINYLYNIIFFNRPEGYSLVPKEDLRLYLIFEFIVVYNRTMFLKPDGYKDGDLQNPADEKVKILIREREEKVRAYIENNKALYTANLYEELIELSYKAEEDFRKYYYNKKV